MIKISLYPNMSHLYIEAVFIRDFARIRRNLDTLKAITLANALVSSILDYCNSLLFSLLVKEKKQAPENPKHFVSYYYYSHPS